jgi:hypothetical protein
MQAYCRVCLAIYKRNHKRKIPAVS